VNSAEWRRAGLLAAAVLTLHIVGFAILLAPHGAGSALGVGVGITAYTLGLRHAFDADHIAAIDNTTRKLMSRGERPLSVGFFFSLGHSTIVFVAALGVHGLSGRLQDSSALSVVGTTVSGSFLYLIALANLVLLAGALRDGPAAQPSGPMFRLFGRLFRTVDKPWHMYPVGLLFGLGFDTATEVALLILAAGAALGGLPMYAIVCLPILFAAGMSLLDTLDGAFMAFAYGWAFAKPVRKLYYNLTVTGLSVAVALGIGSLELLSALGVAEIDLGAVGYVVVALFAVTWLVSMAVWRFGRIEQRWAPAGRV
jgi:nickel/cobalt transporter (NiCoT) family protein